MRWHGYGCTYCVYPRVSVTHVNCPVLLAKLFLNLVIPFLAQTFAGIKLNYRNGRDFHREFVCFFRVHALIEHFAGTSRVAFPVRYVLPPSGARLVYFVFAKCMLLVHNSIYIHSCCSHTMPHTMQHTYQ